MQVPSFGDWTLTTSPPGRSAVVVFEHQAQALSGMFMIQETPNGELRYVTFRLDGGFPVGLYERVRGGLSWSARGCSSAGPAAASTWRNRATTSPGRRATAASPSSSTAG